MLTSATSVWSQGMDIPHAITVDDLGYTFAVLSSGEGSEAALIILAHNPDGVQVGRHSVAVEEGVMNVTLRCVDTRLLIGAARPASNGRYSSWIAAFEKAELLAVQASEAASQFGLRSSYPNPVPRGTDVRIIVETQSVQYLRLDLYSITGERTATLLDAICEAGSYHLPLATSALSTGVYLLILKGERGLSTSRLLVLQ
jgi:hypothetical protein